MLKGEVQTAHPLFSLFKNSIKMKETLLVAFLIGMQVPVWAQIDYSSGDTLHVWAMPSLNMRSAPNLTANIVEKIAYGEKVVVAPGFDSIWQYPSEVEFFTLDESPNAGWKFFWGDSIPAQKSIQYKGNWVKVVFGQKTGYVFDGFLSRLPAFMYSPKAGQDGAAFLPNYKVREDFREYGDRTFGLLDKNGNDSLLDKYEHRVARYIYKGGILFIDETGSNWSSSVFVLPGYSFQEGILFVQKHLLWEFFPKAASPNNWPDEYWTILEYKQWQLLVLQIELTEVRIEKIGDLLVICIFSSC